MSDTVGPIPHDVIRKERCDRARRHLYMSRNAMRDSSIPVQHTKDEEAIVVLLDAAYEILKAKNE